MTTFAKFTTHMAELHPNLLDYLRQYTLGVLTAILGPGLCLTPLHERDTVNDKLWPCRQMVAR